MNVSPLPTKEIENLREAATRAISPIIPLESTLGLGRLPWEARRTKAGGDLPHYYLVYFLLVELLRFPNLGKFEKIAWSVPIDFEGTTYLVEHRKFGVGIFCENPDAHEDQAKRIVSLISSGVKVADSFFRSLADDAVRQSHINVKNNSSLVFQRYEHLRDKFRETWAEGLAREGEVVTLTADQVSGTSNPIKLAEHKFPSFKLMREARWIGIAAVDAFFAWTEHVFIHLAVIQGRVTTGDEVAGLIGAEWQEKYKQALDITDKDSKRFYDLLGAFRRQIRNYMAHGAFGKQGEAFSFHSGAGAVPVMLDEVRGTIRFSLLSGETEFEEQIALSTIEEFIAYLWSGPRQPARTYIQDADLPLILTFASDGTYKAAMQSVEDMERFAHGLTMQFDNAANMDW